LRGARAADGRSAPNRNRNCTRGRHAGMNACRVEEVLMEACTGSRLAWAGLWVASVLASACGPKDDSVRGPRFTIDDLYSLPRIIGTAPKDPSWSRDAKHLAFLWNDEGTNFYDVWAIGVGDPKPVRVTRMPRPAPPE